MEALARLVLFICHLATAQADTCSYEVSLPAKYSYQEVPLPWVNVSTSLTAEVKACKDAHVAISNSLDLSKDMLELVFGANNNTFCAIRTCKQGCRIATYIGATLSCTNFQKVWIAWGSPGVRLGLGGEVDKNTLMATAFGASLAIRHVWISMYSGLTGGDWKINCTYNETSTSTKSDVATSTATPTPSEQSVTTTDISISSDQLTTNRTPDTTESKMKGPSTSLDLTTTKTSLDLTTTSTSLDLTTTRTSLDLATTKTSLDLTSTKTSLDLTTTGTSLDLTTTKTSLDLTTTGTSLDLTTKTSLDLTTTGTSLDLTTTKTSLDLTTTETSLDLTTKTSLDLTTTRTSLDLTTTKTSLDLTTTNVNTTLWKTAKSNSRITDETSPSGEKSDISKSTSTFTRESVTFVTDTSMQETTPTPYSPPRCCCEQVRLMSMMKAWEIVEELTLNKQTSAKRRRLESASDNRASAQLMGLTAVAVLVTVSLVVMIPDLITLFVWTAVKLHLVKKNRKGLQRPLTYSVSNN